MASSGHHALNDNEDHALHFFYRGKATEFVELHDQVQTSVNLLDSLQSFLSTFQKDLQAVSSQISELQDRSKDIESRLKSRRKIERPLSSLISDITLSPQLATTILDTDVGEPWIAAIVDFERRLVMIKSRARVKGARDLGEVAEGLRIVAATKLRIFFLALFQPIRKSVTTNMQVMQTSVLLKYSPLFAFLQRQAPDVAQEVQRSYVGSARVYYETGFRRYVRSLGYIKARRNERFEPITSAEPSVDSGVDLDRLAYARLDGPAVALSYMADDKTHKEPAEALLRSLFLVFMDNSTTEYTFIKSFFNHSPTLPSLGSRNPIPVVHAPQSPDRLSFAEERTNIGSEWGDETQMTAGPAAPISTASPPSTLKKDQNNIDLIWKQVMEPVLEYCQNFVNTVIEPPPPIIPLLTMIRLIEVVVVEIQMRQCPPVESYVFTIRLRLWPVFQKLMTENVEALKKLAEGSSTSYFSRAPSTTETIINSICSRYVTVFNSFVHLTDHEEETMIFSNLLRLRQELAKLIVRHTNQISDVVSRVTKQASTYQHVLQGMSKGTQLTAHPKLQQELAYWSNLEEETSRKIVSMGQSRTRH
ncbi:vacuolar sorting protein [Amanita muscaria]